jgi:LysR family transcriptional regulator, nitrogen assimilation regulatory protein
MPFNPEIKNSDMLKRHDNLRDMDLKQLESFVRVAELGSFTRAAVELGVAQPALSRQVRQLEVELHQHLLKRNGRGAVVTEAGQTLLQHARGILHQVERAREELGQVKGSLAGRVALGMPPTISRSLTVPLVQAFRKAMPGATLSIRESLSAAMQEDLVKGRLDLALLYNPASTSEVQIQPLIRQKLFVIQRRHAVSAPNSMTFGELGDLPLVIPSRPNAIRMLLESEMAKIGKVLNVVLEIDGVSAILDLVEAGAGSAVLTRDAIENSSYAQAFRLRPIAKPGLDISVMLAQSALRPHSATQQMTAKLIEATVADILKP